MFIEICIASFISLIIPILMGDLILPNEALGKRYIMGMLTTLAIAQVVYFPLVLLHRHHYFPYFIGYVIIVIGLCFYSIYNNRMTYKDRLKSVFSIERWLDGKSIWLVLSVLLVGFQVVRCVFGHFFVYADDSHYITLINDLLETDLYNDLYYVNGSSDFVETDVKYLFTTYFPYLATISRLSGLHPSILVQTVLPFFLTISLYSLVWHYGMLLFKQKKNAWMFVFFFAVLVETMSGYLLTHANHVIVSIYYGKKIVFTIFLPFIMLFIAEKTSMLEGKVKNLSKKDVVALFIMMLGTCAPSLMGTGLAPIVLFSMGATLCVRKKSIVPMVQMGMGMFPAIVVLLMVIYHMFIRG